MTGTVKSCDCFGSAVRAMTYSDVQDLINTLKNKSLTMTYETQKLVQERDYRDNCLIKGEIAQQKLNRQIFVLKVNLKDLKESNARLKVRPHCALLWCGLSFPFV